MGEYAGESFPKKIARADAWDRITERCGGLRACHGKRVLVLSGPSGGDVLSAMTRGFQPHNIVAVDCDADAIRSASAHVSRRLSELRSRVPEMGVLLPGEPTFVHGRAEDVWKTYRRSFDVVFLDFCTYASPKSVETFARIAAKCSRSNAVVGVGFMYGREKDPAVVNLRDRLLKRDGFVDVMTAPHPGLISANMGAAYAQATGLYDRIEAADAEEFNSLSTRKLYVSDLMKKIVPSLGVAMPLVDFFGYKSGDDGSGVPMIYLVGVREDGDHRQALAREIPFAVGRKVKSPRARETVREWVVNAPPSVHATFLAMAYDIEPSQVAAWRAVATREARAAALHEAAE